MTDQPEQEYDESFVSLLELIWGEGYLSPGGPEEIAKLLEGVDLGGKQVLDVGCGTGGIDTLLVQQYRAAHVTGVDVGSTVIEKSLERAEELGLLDRLSFEQVEPGPFTFYDDSFDVVFSKDAMVHISNKKSLFSEVIRVLKPGGVFVASDWMCRDTDPSPEMQQYIRVEGLDFGMGRAIDYHEAMIEAGFSNILFTDRNEWYQKVARNELAELSGPLYSKLLEIAGVKVAEHEIGVWRAMTVVLDSGELRPTHMRAIKPERE